MANFQSRGDAFYEELLLKATSGVLEEKPFMVVKANVIRHPMNKDIVFPVEFSMAAFSLNRGVIQTYTTLIEPQPLPVGAAYYARVLKDDSDLPIPGVDPEFTEAHRDYATIADNVKRMVLMHLSGSTGRLAKKYVFVMSSDLSAAVGTFKWLAEHSGDSELSSFLLGIEFLDLSKLFFRMSRIVNTRNPLFINGMSQFQLVVLGEKQLNKPNGFSFRPEITCPFHCSTGYNKMDMCAKNWILRRIFIIIEEFLDALEIEKTSGHDIEKYPFANFTPLHVVTRNRSICPFIVAHKD